MIYFSKIVFFSCRSFKNCWNCLFELLDERGRTFDDWPSCGEGFPVLGAEVFVQNLSATSLQLINGVPPSNGQ